MSCQLGTWTEETFAEHPCSFYEPPSRNQHGYVLVYLHGVHEGRIDQPEFCESLARHGLPVVAPVTGRSWWTDRIFHEFDPKISAERHILDHVLPMIAERFDAAPPCIGLFGTSMGGQGALRLAYKYPDLFPVVAGISPAIDYYRRMAAGDESLESIYEHPEEARQDSATLHIHPLNWPRHQFFCCDPTDDDWIESSERLQMKLSSIGVPHEHDLETIGGGHGISYYTTMAEKVIAFLSDRLDRERLRVV